ncbi:hypothetical protein Tco_1544539, partial [Tanacetum coccineum]
SSDSSEEGVGTPAGRVILFGTIPTTIPDTTPSSDLSIDPSSDHIPPLPATSPFLLSTDDSLDSNMPDTPPSPTHGTPFTETTLSTQRLVYMMTVRKRVGLLLTHRLAVRHSVDYSSSDHFSSDDSSRDSSSSSSSGSSLGTRPSHHLCSLVSSIPHSSATITDRPFHDSSFASPSRKRSRSPTESVPLSSSISGALYFAHADLLPSPKRIKSPESVTNLEVSSIESSEPARSRGTDVKMDIDVERSDGLDIDPKIQAEIDECVAYADALKARGIDARVVVEAVDPEEPAQEGAVEVTYETLGDLVQRFHDHTVEIPVHHVQAIESI